MTTIAVHELDIDSAVYIATNMRPSDIEEFEALGFPGEATPEGAADSFLACLPSAWAVFLGDEPVAMLGASLSRPGVWQVGMFGTDKFDQVQIATTRFVVRGMIPAIRSTGAHRAHAFSLASHETAHRWLELLGARREARLVGYGSGGEDFLVYVWDRNVQAKRQVRPDRSRGGREAPA